jgi:hypothetical protein
MPPIGWKGTAIERFMRLVHIDQNSGCWLWTGSVNHRGYGWFGVGGRKGGTHLAHRWSYEHHIGPISKSLSLDHLCRTPGCVNPAHLEAVALRENILRSNGPSARQARRMNCAHGHLLDGRLSNGKRYCKTCNRLKAQARRIAQVET